MICRYFLEDIRIINSDIIINEGNSVTRFSKSALKILLLSDHVLSRELQVKLTGMKKMIRSNLYLFEYAGNVSFKVLGLKKATARRYVEYLHEFEEYATALYNSIQSSYELKPKPSPDTTRGYTLAFSAVEKMNLDFRDGYENPSDDE